MRLIITRHAQSANNVLSDISYEKYTEGRSDDAHITEKGEKDAVILGN